MEPDEVTMTVANSDEAKWYDVLGRPRREEFAPWLAVPDVVELPREVALTRCLCSACGAQFDVAVTSYPTPVSGRDARSLVPTDFWCCEEERGFKGVVELVLERWEHLGGGTWARRG